MTPKIATYHSAKGLTFDSALLPRLINNSFQWINDDDLRRRLIFVGIARATQWVYISTETGKEIADMNILRTAERNHHLTIQDGKTAPTQARLSLPMMILMHFHFNNSRCIFNGLCFETRKKAVGCQGEVNNYESIVIEFFLDVL